MKTNLKTMLLLIYGIIVLTGCAASDYGYSASYYYNQGKYDEAIENAKQAIQMEPKYPYAWYWLGMAYTQKDRWEEAIKALNKRLELDPNPSSPQYQSSYKWLAISYFNNGQIDKSISAIRRAIELKPQDKDSRLILDKIRQRQKKNITIKYTANIYAAINQGNFNFATIELKRKGPEMNPVAWSHPAGDLFLSLCDPDGAIRLYEEGIKFSSNSNDTSRLRQKICLAYEAKRDATRTRQYCGGIGFIGVEIKIQDGEIAVVNVMPNLPSAKAGLQPGDYILQVAGVPVNDLGQCISLIRQVEPGSHLALKIRREEQMIDKIITVGSVFDIKGKGPPNPAACRAQELNREGVAFARVGKNVAALKKFEEALQKSPGPLPKAHYNTALILEQLDRPREALRHYIKAQESFLLPEDEIGALTRLVALTRQARISVPDTADRRYRVGIIRAQQKRYKEAIQEFEAAIVEAPWMVAAYYNLGRVYDFNKEYSKALRVLHIYIKLAPNASNVGPVKSKIVELEERLVESGIY